MRIFLVRHGESLGNIDDRAYRQFGDHNVPLTEWGHRQVLQAGQAISAYLKGLPPAEFAQAERLVFSLPEDAAEQGCPA
ncbi:broad specificity phosphatase PhoE [Rhizobium sp. BK347]|nr:broad specificity phosphatase PhoE [Rhizobium sp. BK252]MBB3483467.1 broad specificity phosphatase PhoE [Rhizobium sp. BK347]